MPCVSVFTFNRLAPAHQMRQRLEQAGIKVVLREESRFKRFWFMSEPLAVIHLDVDQADFVAVRQWSRQWDLADEVMREAVRCPECGSSRVEFPQITRKFITPVLQALLLAVHAIPQEFYCLDCQFTWPKEKRQEPERDVLGWRRDSKLWHPEQPQKQTRL